ncbi:hypothetical protein HDU77_001595, partial [Chytriomyces hyalinus]
MNTIHNGYLDPGCNKTLITDPDWFESFTEVNISIGTASSSASLIGSRQGCVHFDFDGVIVTIPDAIFAENLVKTLFSDHDILQNNPTWKYEVDRTGATFYSTDTGAILFTAKTSLNNLK